MNQLPRSLAHSLACVVFFVGVGRLGLAAAADAPPEAPSKAPVGEKSTAKEVSVADAQKWAAALQRAVRVQDVDTFNKLVDWDAFVETATALPGNSAQLKAFREAFQRGLKSATASPRTGFGRAIIAGVDGPGEYRPLHTHREAGRTHVLFRLISTNGALELSRLGARPDKGG